MKSIELFAGAGGLSLGLEKAGWESKMLLERNHHACNTLRLNKEAGFPLSKNWNIFEGDVRDITYDEISEEIDLVAGGPPCQPFSLGGKHNAQKDERDMFPEAIRAIRELGPKYFLFENVKGLLRKSFATYFQYILLRLEFPFEGERPSEGWEAHYNRLLTLKDQRIPCASKYVYNVNFKLVNAASFGVPQHRYRIIIVGIREDQGWSFKFPQETHSEESLLLSKYITKDYWRTVGAKFEEDIEIYKALHARVAKLDALLIPPENAILQPYRTVFQAIGDLPPPPKVKNKLIPNHILREGARAYPGHTGSPLHFPSKAIKAGVHGVPGGENMIAFANGTYRYYTTREAARVQTFPDKYVFSGSWTESMRQIGNAVPVDLAYILGKALFEQSAENEKREKRREQRSLQPAR